MAYMRQTRYFCQKNYSLEDITRDTKAQIRGKGKVFHVLN